MSDATEHTEVFSGYLAELIKLQAERAGVTPEEYVISFFCARCNAPRRMRPFLLDKQQ